MNKDLSWCAYHKELGVKYVYSEQEYEALLSDGWVNTPAKFDASSVETVPQKKKKAIKSVVGDANDSSRE